MTFIALDVDGVLADTYVYILRNMGLDPSILRTYRFEDTYGKVDAKQIDDEFHVPETWERVPVISGARKAVQRLHAAGVPFIFLSAFPDQFRSIRERWIERELGVSTEDHPLAICPAKDKAEVARWLGITHVVEDRPATANAVAEEGLVSILVPSSYAHEIELDDRVTIQSLTSFTQEIVRKEAASEPPVCSIDGDCRPGAASPTLTH